MCCVRACVRTTDFHPHVLLSLFVRLIFTFLTFLFLLMRNFVFWKINSLTIDVLLLFWCKNKHVGAFNYRVYCWNAIELLRFYKNNAFNRQHSGANKYVMYYSLRSPYRVDIPAVIVLSFGQTFFLFIKSSIFF